MTARRLLRPRTFDILARNADWRTEDEFEPFTFVFAAGNSGSGQEDDETRIGSPGEAKNLIAVAASTNARGGADGLDVAPFSSRGPAVDGRVAPTVTAPGADIVSTRAFTATAVCGLPPRDAFGLYASCSGTSMAAPHTTGAVALLTEWWHARHRRGGDPSPAMIRALLVNTAEPLTPGESIPNRDEGWGRIHLGNLFDPKTRWVLSDEKVVFTRRGDSHTVSVRPVRPSKPLRVTVAWSDAPGAAGADPALVNDLDLIVERVRGGRAGRAAVARQRAARKPQRHRREGGPAQQHRERVPAPARAGHLPDHGPGAQPPRRRRAGEPGAHRPGLRPRGPERPHRLLLTRGDRNRGARRVSLWRSSRDRSSLRP